MAFFCVEQWLVVVVVLAVLTGTMMAFFTVTHGGHSADSWFLAGNRMTFFMVSGGGHRRVAVVFDGF